MKSQTLEEWNNRKGAEQKAFIEDYRINIKKYSNRIFIKCPHCKKRSLRQYRNEMCATHGTMGYKVFCTNCDFTGCKAI